MVDDILLKIIVWLNFGLVLLYNGKIIKKWYYKKLLFYDDIKFNYILGGN